MRGMTYVRTALGVLYAIHALLILALFAAEHGALFIALAEALAAFILVSGIHTRAMALLLLPLPVAAALSGFATGGFVAICIVGQTALAAWRAEAIPSLIDLYE